MHIWCLLAVAYENVLGQSKNVCLTIFCRNVMALFHGQLDCFFNSLSDPQKTKHHIDGPLWKESNPPVDSLHKASLGKAFPYHDVTMNVMPDMEFKLFISNYDVTPRKRFPRYRPFVRGIHRSAVDSPHKVPVTPTLMFSLMLASTNSWIIRRVAGDLRRHDAHCDVIVMQNIGHDKDMYDMVLWDTDHGIHRFMCFNPLSARTALIWLLMHWLLASPEHQHPWYWLCRKRKFLSYLRKDFNYLCHVKVEQRHKM